MRLSEARAPFDDALLAELEGLWRRAWDEGDDPPAWLRATHPDAVLFLAHDDDALVGARLTFPWTDGTAHYSLLCLVAPSHRSRGIASTLLKRHVDWATAAGYERVLADNSPARPAMLRLNLRHGFALEREEVRNGRVHHWMALRLR